MALLGAPRAAAALERRWGEESERASGVDDGVVLEEEEPRCACSDRAFASVLDNQVDARWSPTAACSSSRKKASAMESVAMGLVSFLVDSGCGRMC